MYTRGWPTFFWGGRGGREEGREGEREGERETNIAITITTSKELLKGLLKSRYTTALRSTALLTGGGEKEEGSKGNTFSLMTKIGKSHEVILLTKSLTQG
jgi:hypothetical protein